MTTRGRRPVGDSDEPSYTLRDIARSAKLPVSTLRRWITALPIVRAPRWLTRTYRRDELLCLLVASELATSGFTHREIKAIIKQLQAQDRPVLLPELQLTRQQRQVYFRRPDGRWGTHLGGSSPGTLYPTRSGPTVRVVVNLADLEARLPPERRPSR